MPFLFPCFFSHSQILPTNYENKFLTKKLDLKGLPADSYFGSVQQDDEGFLWIGTLGGLYRYDGSRIMHFLHDPADSNSLGNNYAYTLNKDQKGNIWIGTFGSGFINMYDKNSGKIKRIEPHINNPLRVTVRKIKTALNGETIIAATTQCIYKISLTGITIDSFLFAHAQSLITDFVEYENDKFIVAASFAIFILDWKHRNILELPLASKSVTRLSCIEKDQSGNFWVGSHQGLLILKPGDFTFSDINDDVEKALKNIEINVIRKDRTGRMWLGTNAGLFVAYNKQIQKINSAVNITDIFIDKKSTAWITTADNGFYQVSEPGILFQTIPGIEAYSKKNKIQSIIEEKPGAWLIGTMFGLYRYYFATQLFEKIQPGNSTEDSKISYQFKDKNNGLWIGTAGQGIFYKPAAEKEYIQFRYKEENENSIPSDFIVSFAEDEYNNIWIGTYSEGRKVKSLCFYDPHAQKINRITGNVSDPKAFNASAISQIETDSEHQLWIGTWDMGLFRSLLTGNAPEQNTFTNYTESSPGSHKISHSVVSCVKPGRNGIVWFGTISGGLNVLDSKRDSAYWFTVKDGLPSNLIYRIEEDDQGIIWMSTDYGIARFDPATRSFINYNTTSGLPANNFTSLTSMKCTDGTIAFGTNDGQVVYFNPNSYKNSVNTQAAVITDIRLFNKSLETGFSSVLKKSAYLTDTLQLNYDQSVISFELSNMDFLNPEIYTYAYKLNGFDKDWTYITDRNSITYTNLDPGTYTLLVKQANHLGIWNEQPTKLVLIITPPFWKTWWFYLLSLLVLGFLIFSYARGYVKSKLKKQQNVLEKQKAIELERRRISAELHDDLGGGLSTIRLLSEMIKPGSLHAEALKQLNTISESSKELVEKLNEIVWALNVNNDNLQSLLIYTRQYAVKFLDDVNILCKAEIPDKIPDLHVSGKNRRNIFLLVKETLHNVVKHANASAVELILSVDDALHISIRDNGKGIPAEMLEKRPGNGLKNMQRRIKEMNGSMEIKNIAGTQVIFILPVSNPHTKR